MLELLAAFGGAYFATAVIAAFLLVAVEAMRPDLYLEKDELFMYALLWPLVLYGLALGVFRSARRAFTGLIANAVGFYWRVRAKLPF